MKATKSGQKWAHVSCALWIPEVSIGCVEKMEPITKISKIPPSRWNLVCVLCKERVGSCIQVGAFLINFSFCFRNVHYIHYFNVYVHTYFFLVFGQNLQGSLPRNLRF
jgi:hypothetical protein